MNERRRSDIQAAVKHPMLLAIKIWSTAHLIANGDLGSILLFGSFAPGRSRRGSA